MNILGVGPLELLFIFLIALIVLGPKDIVKASQTMGRWLRSIVRSDTWRIIRETSREIRNIPSKMMRESGLDEISKSIPSSAELKNAMGYDELQKETNKISSDLSNLTGTQTIAPIASGSIASQQSGQKPATNQEPPSSDWTTPRQKIIKPEPPPVPVPLENSETGTPQPAIQNTPETTETDTSAG